MAKTLVGALRVTLGLDSAEFAAGAARAQGIGNRLGKSLATIGVAAAGLATGIAAGVQVTINRMDSLTETAEKLGMPVEALTALKYAAEQSGVPFETLETSLVKLSQNLANSPQKFADLGVAIRDADGAMRPTAEIVADLADKFQAMPDGAEKTALAMDLFGKSGSDMVLALNGGSEGLQGLMDEARKLGIVFSEETGEAAGRFNDNLGKLSTAAGGLGIQLAASLAPSLETISGFAVDAAMAFSELSPETKEMVAQVGAAIAIIGGAALAFGLLSLAISPISVTIGLIAAGAKLIYDNWDGIVAWFSNVWAQIKQSTEQAWEFVKNVINGRIAAIQRKWDALVAALQGAIQVAKDVGTAIADALNVGDSTAVGDAVTSGFTNGILGGRNGVLAAMTELGMSAGQALRDSVDSNSPSRVTHDIGLDVAQGLANGIAEGGNIVSQAAKGLGDTAAGALDTLGDLGGQIGDMFATAATNVLTGVESLREAVGKLLQQVAQLLINSAMKSLFGNVFQGLNLGGVPGYATGTMNAAAGWAMVGEQGPELVRLRGGERIYDARQTDRMMAGGGDQGAGPTQIRNQVYLDGTLILDKLDTVEGEMAMRGPLRRLGVTG